MNTHHFDLLVIGGGLAGFAAALSAAEAGLHVALLEKTAQTGGSSAMSGGCLAFAGTDLQGRHGIDDSSELLFRDLVPQGAVERDVHQRFTAIKLGSGTFRMNVALSELPDFVCRPGKQAQDHHGSGIVIGPTLDYLERAYLDARTYGWARQPVVEMLIPSTLDASLAPEGRHVASLFVQHVAPHLPDGRSWDTAKDEASGQQCKAYGAPGVMRMPGRLRISWQDDETLKIETDAGRQTRLLRFRPGATPTGARDWQGYSTARWEPPASGAFPPPAFALSPAHAGEPRLPYRWPNMRN